MSVLYIDKNRSNKRLYFIGSATVIPNSQDTILPPHEPLPGPIAILFSFAYFIISQTIKKYPLVKLVVFL